MSKHYSKFWWNMATEVRTSSRGSSLPIVFAEYHPRLSALHLYLTSDWVNPLTRLIEVEEGRALISQYPQLHISFPNYSIAGDHGEIMLDRPSLDFPYTIHTRLVVSPTASINGSAAVEILKHPSEADEETLKRLSRNSRNPIPLFENSPHSLHCINCEFRLGQNLIFNKIRPLPGHYWEDRANDMWFCHPPHPDSNVNACDSSEEDESSATNGEDKLLDSVNNLQLNPPCGPNSFQIIQNPGPSTILYGPSYWIMDPQLLHIGRESLDAVPGNCGRCGQEVGCYLSPTSVQLWSSAVCWDDGVDWLIPGSAFDDFRRLVSSIIKESDNFRPKILLKSSNGKRSLFLWTWNPDATIFLPAEEKESQRVLVTMKEVKSIKFMMTSLDVTDGIVLETDVILTVPFNIIEAGLRGLFQIPVNVSIPVTNSAQQVLLECAFLAID